MRQNKTLQIAVIANLSALSVVLYYFVRFPLPFIFPAFLEVQISNVPAAIGGFMFGPIAGSAVVVIRTLIKLPASHTAFVGELADLIIGVATVVTSSLIYRKMRTKQGALLASIAGAFVWVVVATLSNYFIIIPFYIDLYFDGNVGGLLNMLEIIPGITEDNYLWRFALFASIPFNLLLSVLVYGLTFILYKRFKHLIESIHQKMETS